VASAAAVSSDVHVQPFELGRAADRLECVLGRDAEFRAVMRGSDRLVRVGLDPWRDADQHARNAGRTGPVDLLERVEHDERAVRTGLSELLVGLVVAVHDDQARIDAGALRKRELAQCRDIGRDALLGEEAQDREVRKRLRAVGDPRLGRSLAVGASVGAQRGLVVDEQGAAEALHELGRGDAAEHELAGVDRRSIGKEFDHKLDSACGSNVSILGRFRDRHDTQSWLPCMQGVSRPLGARGGRTSEGSGQVSASAVSLVHGRHLQRPTAEPGATLPPSESAPYVSEEAERGHAAPASHGLSPREAFSY